MPGLAVAQDTVTALPVSMVHWASGPLKLDGIPIEPAWFQTDSIVDFIQEGAERGRAGHDAHRRTHSRCAGRPAHCVLGL